MRKNKTFLAIAALGATMALALSGCSGETTDEASSKETIKFISMDGADDVIAPTLLWQAVLEDEGYDVEISHLGDVGVAYIALANGDADIYTTSWLPVTQGAYWDEYADSIDKLGVWNTEAKLAMAVNEDAPIDSLEELAANADEFDNRIIGIEPGAGMTELVQSELIPDYGLEDMEFIISSTTAMLTELKASIDDGNNVVVTLWQPHWAYGAFPLKNLDDPKGVLGAAEELTAVGRAGFADDHPEVATWIKNWSMDTATLSSLQAALFQDTDPSKYESRLAEWMDENSDYVASLTS